MYVEAFIGAVCSVPRSRSGSVRPATRLLRSSFDAFARIVQRAHKRRRVAEAKPQKVEGQRAGRDGERDTSDDAADSGLTHTLGGTLYRLADKALRPQKRRRHAGD